MNAISNALRYELRDVEYSEGYAESFLNSYVATQIKVLREQRGLSQPQLANLTGTTQSGISRIENVNYSSWNVGTLKKVARALNVRLKVSFEPYGTLPEEVESFSRESLQRPAREDDPGLRDAPANQLVISDNLAAFKYNLGVNLYNAVGVIPTYNVSLPNGDPTRPSQYQMLYNLLYPNLNGYLSTDYYLGAKAFEGQTFTQATRTEEPSVERVLLAGPAPIALAA